MRNMKFIKGKFIKFLLDSGTGDIVWLLAALENFYLRIPAVHDAAAFWVGTLPSWIFIIMEFCMENVWYVLKLDRLHSSCSSLTLLG